MRDEDQVRRYIESVGHPPENREDDPDWDYRGTRKEFEALKERLGLEEEGDVPAGQMELC